MSMNVEKVTIPFLNWTIRAFRADSNDELMVACRPIAEMIGLDWKGQRVKLLTDSRFRGVLIPSVGRNGSSREMLCIPKNRLGAWLYGINSNRVKESVAPLLMQFQENVVSVIDAYMHNTLTMQKLQLLESMVVRLQKELADAREEIRELKARPMDYVRPIRERGPRNPTVA